MNDVYTLLRERCAFDCCAIPQEEETWFSPGERELSPALCRLDPPEDLLAFYRHYDGGHQLFVDHGWKPCQGPVRLTLYRQGEMETQKTELLQAAQSGLTEHCGEAGYSAPETARFQEQLAAAFRSCLLIGEIGKTDSARLQQPLNYILCCRGSLYVMEREFFPTLGLHPLKDSLSVYLLRRNALFDRSLAGLLGKILDVILKGHATVFELRAEQQKLRDRERKAQQEEKQPRGRSLYERISEAVVDGTLPRDFTLQKKEDSQKLVWADGAFDGVMLYHMAKRELSDDLKGLIVLMIDSAGAGLFTTAEAQIAELVKQTRALTVVDLIQEYVLNNREKLHPPFVYAFAMILASTSDNTECVKIGLSILELFKPDENVKQIVRTLALCDEFTFFTNFVMRLWENGNREIFEAAKKVHGWGRIHAVHMLEPDSEEIRSWLLQDGMKNNVLREYSALECWIKSGAEALLTGEAPLPTERFACIREILGVLLEEGPVPGISGLENAERSVLRFLERAKRETLSDEDAGVIREIAEYYSAEDCHNPWIAQQCAALLASRQQTQPT